MDGWIQLHRRILDWDWYSDVNTKVLFIHLLLKANFVDKSWKGNTIKRGQVFTSIKHLSVELKLSEKQIRTALKKLITTQEVASKGANDGTMLTICKYDSYQCFEKEKGEQKVNQGASEGQTKGDNLTTIINEQPKKETISTIDFDKFWDLYDKKKGSKSKCISKWNKLKQSEKDKIFETLPIFLKSINDKQFQPFPETYLTDKRWNDELTLDIPDTLGYNEQMINGVRMFNRTIVIPKGTPPCPSNMYHWSSDKNNWVYGN